MAKNLASEALRRRAGQTLERVQVESADLARTRHPVEYLHVDTLVPWAEQPRREFDADALTVFAQEILEHGVNHALVIRAESKKPGNQGLIGSVSLSRAGEGTVQLHER